MRHECIFGVYGALGHVTLCVYADISYPRVSEDHFTETPPNGCYEIKRRPHAYHVLFPGLFFVFWARDVTASGADVVQGL